jgi:Family of unknown function (DUF5910)
MLCRYCIIYAESDKLNAISKAWVPKTYGGTELWWKPAAIDTYIKTLDSSWVPTTTLRMSIIDGSTGEQMVIPPALIGTNGGKGPLGITATCKEKETDIPNVDVDYTRWPNVKGSK